MEIFNKGNKMSRKTFATTIISKGAKIKGDFELEAKLHIDGEVEAFIKSNSDVIVSKSGFLKGKVNCKRFILSGKFEGEIECNVLEIMKNGFLKGSIVVNDFIVEEGGIFEGESKIKREDASKKF
jgi:cytoskeletal protein CcmA (bactofilin family)